MSNSTEKLAIEFIKINDKKTWVDVVLLKYLNRPRFRPSFEDLYRIIQALAVCEDEKYPPPRFKGRGKIDDFLRDVVYSDSFELLAQKYNIPERNGDRVINTNGANLEDAVVEAPLISLEPFISRLNLP